MVYCPESRDAQATQSPMRRTIEEPASRAEPAAEAGSAAEVPIPKRLEAPAYSAPPAGAPIPKLKEQHFRITYGATGFSYDSILGDYLAGAKEVVVEDPYIRLNHQIQNFVRFCETVVSRAPVKTIHLITGIDNATQQAEAIMDWTSI